MLSDNGSQMVGVARELREMVYGLDAKQLQEFCGEKGIQWIFTTPAVPHQNGCAEALVKSYKNKRTEESDRRISSNTVRVVHLRVRGRKPNEPASHRSHS